MLPIHFQIIRWLMGSLTVVGYQELKQLLPFVTLTTVVIIYLSRELNLLMAGDEIATSRGVSVKYVRYALFFCYFVVRGCYRCFMRSNWLCRHDGATYL